MDAKMASPDPRNVPTLRDLLDRHRDRSNESNRALGDRSGVKHQTIGEWYSGEIVEFPKIETIRRFAKATGYSEQTVVLATARTIGLRITETNTPLVNSLPPGTDSLSADDVDAVRAVVRQLVEARRVAEPALRLDHVEGLRLAEEDTTVTSDSRTNH